jgi:hypothetical protein
VQLAVIKVLFNVGSRDMPYDRNVGGLIASRYQFEVVAHMLASIPESTAYCRLFTGMRPFRSISYIVLYIGYRISFGLGGLQGNKGLG